MSDCRAGSKAEMDGCGDLHEACKTNQTTKIIGCVAWFALCLFFDEFVRTVLVQHGPIRFQEVHVGCGSALTNSGKGV